MFTRLHHIVHPFCEHSHLSRRVCSSCNFNRSLHNIHGTLGMFFRKRECCSCVDNHVNVKQGRVCLHVILQAVRIAGNAYGLKNDVKTHSPLFYVHMVLDAGTTFPLPKEHPERAVYVVKGSIEVAGRTYSPGQMTVFTKGMDDVVKASEHSTIMFLGGEPVGDRFIWWNFVSSRKERIEQAKADWKAGRIIFPPNDNQEFVPLPEDRSRPAGGPTPQALS